MENKSGPQRIDHKTERRCWNRDAHWDYRKQAEQRAESSSIANAPKNHLSAGHNEPDRMDDSRRANVCNLLTV